MARRAPQIARTNANGTGKSKRFSLILEGKGSSSQPNLTTTASLSLVHKSVPALQADTLAAATLLLIVWIISGLAAVVADLFAYLISKHVEPVVAFSLIDMLRNQESGQISDKICRD